MLGFLVTMLSIFTAAANYATYNAGGAAAGYSAEGDRLLADANTDYIQSTQLVIVDYTMYDGYYINDGADDFAAEYYQANFSDELMASFERGDPFDDQYYAEMYADADALLDEAFTKLDLTTYEGEREAGFQLAMLQAAVGLAFAGYGSLLDETKGLRKVFGLMSIITMFVGLVQFFTAYSA
jgi:hypothetical protein